jgi:hypothetical protein
MLVAALAHTYVLSHKLSLPPRLLPNAWRERERERDLETRENYGAYRALHLLPFQTMVEQDWIPSEIMQVDLQDLMS